MSAAKAKAPSNPSICNTRRRQGRIVASPRLIEVKRCFSRLVASRAEGPFSIISLSQLLLSRSPLLNVKILACRINFIFTTSFFNMINIRQAQAGFKQRFFFLSEQEMMQCQTLETNWKIHFSRCFNGDFKGVLVTIRLAIWIALKFSLPHEARWESFLPSPMTPSTYYPVWKSNVLPKIKEKKKKAKKLNPNNPFYRQAFL